MAEELITLAIVALVAAVCPLIAQRIPRKSIPEAVLLIAFGALLGPYGLNVIHTSSSLTLLSDLGLAVLFLLAGYEIDPRELTDAEGRRGLVTWVVTLGLAILVVMMLPADFITTAEGHAAATIVLTTTALGTLMPILTERGLMGTRVGDLVIKFGTWGELGPVLAMAVLLSVRSKAQTALILLVLALFCVFTAHFAKRARRDGSKFYHFMTQNADSTAQTFVRFTVLLLIVFVALSAVFDLDIVLGAFAAGFVLRYVIPEGNKNLEGKLNAIGYGFLIPLFFVASGMKIDLAAIGQRPVLLVVFIFLLLLVRAVPVYISLITSPSVRADVSRTNCLSVAFYCTTALPIIVAVTSVATSSGVMTDEVASVLVAAGAISVFLMPLLASAAYRVSDAEPIHAIHEIRAHEGTPSEVLHTHLEHERRLARERAERARRRAEDARRANEEYVRQHRM